MTKRMRPPAHMLERLAEIERQSEARGQWQRLRNKSAGEMPTSFNGKFSPLPIALQAAVPLWQLQFMHLSFEERAEILKECDRVLWETGEAFLYRIPGKSAAAFNAIAKAVALLSYQPGGCTCFGMHWEAESLTQA